MITFFDNKFRECDEVSQDLNYLNSILNEFKSNKNV